MQIKAIQDASLAYLALFILCSRPFLWFNPTGGSSGSILRGLLTEHSEKKETIPFAFYIQFFDTVFFNTVFDLEVVGSRLEFC